MRILVIGSGGREHALVRSFRADDVHAAPGNPGIAALQDMIGAPVSAVGVGPRRDQTLQLRDLLQQC